MSPNSIPGLLAAILLALPTGFNGTRAVANSTVVAGRVTGPAGQPLSGAAVSVTERRILTTTAADGRYVVNIPRVGTREQVTLRVALTGYQPGSIVVFLSDDSVHADIQLKVAPTNRIRAEGREFSADLSLSGMVVASVQRMPGAPAAMTKFARRDMGSPLARRSHPDSGNTEAYDHLDENPFRSPRVAPLSTFSVDVDRASYSNVRRFLAQGQLPPKDAVRIEELVNYFPYNDPAPAANGAPLRISTEVSAAPWNTNHDLVRIALRARDVDLRKAPPSNLVFLIDVSGSMFGPGRLPLVKQALSLLVHELREDDHVAIVVYAGNAGLVLPSTAGSDKQRILAALDGLEAGGSTAGGAGIKLAYDVARKNFIAGGSNRVILCTDGDFNMGQSSDGELVRLIEQRRTEGSFLTILGFGMGNYKDAKMEKLADAG
ncbi:MAG: hypothetical protein JWM95_4625, partial [Gemmatimonadetes bacterium]|nr:hypothetical protein [Gemmatimonadota bacterium]